MKTILTFIFLFILAITVNCQTTDTTASIDDFYINSISADISAFSILDYTPESIIKPGDVKEISIQLLNILGQGNTIQPNLAFEWAPYRTFHKKAIANYNSTKKTIFNTNRALRNLQFSFATKNDSLGSKVAFGFKWTLNNSDPLNNKELVSIVSNIQKELLLTTPMDYNFKIDFFNNLSINLKKYNFNNDVEFTIEALFNIPNDLTSINSYPSLDYKKSQIDSVLKPIKSTISDSTFNSLENLLYSNAKVYCIKYEDQYWFNQGFNKSQRVVNLLKSFEKTNWNYADFMVSFGWLALSPENTWKGLRMQKYSLLFSGKIPLTKDAAKFGVNVNPFFKLDSYTNMDVLNSKNALSTGAKILGGNSKFRFSLEGLYTSWKKLDNSGVKNLKAMVGIEFPGPDGLWLELALGVNGPTDSFTQKCRNRQPTQL